MFYDPTADDFCEPMNPYDVIFSNQMSALEDDQKNDENNIPVHPFMIAERGGCTFVTKVRNMEETF